MGASSWAARATTSLLPASTPERNACSSLDSATRVGCEPRSDDRRWPGRCLSKSTTRTSPAWSASGPTATSPSPGTTAGASWCRPSGTGGVVVADLSAEGPTPPTRCETTHGAAPPTACSLWPDGQAAPPSVRGYLPDGTWDPTFGVGGRALVDLTPGDDIAYGLAIRTRTAGSSWPAPRHRGVRRPTDPRQWAHSTPHLRHGWGVPHRPRSGRTVHVRRPRSV